MSDAKAAAGVGLATVAAVGVGLLYLFRDRLGGVVEAAEEQAGSIYERVQEVSENGELVMDPISGVFYDDPEQGSLDDEAGDDRNVSFEAANEILADVGAAIDPRRYLPDVEGDTLAPSTGVLPDAGDSQVYGDAPEAEDDDLNRVGNMDDETAAVFDRFANRDTTDSPKSDSTEDSGTSTSTDDLGGLDSGSSYDRFDSGSSSSTSSSTDDDDDGGYTFPGLSDDITSESTTDGTGSSTTDQFLA